MLRTTLAVSLAFLALAPGAARADLELPRPSPLCRAMLTVGLTEVSVDYSSPAVKGRKIWGGLVPYGKIWRTGANAATKLTVSRDITIGDKPLPAGTYGLYTIPNAASWTVVINKDYAQSGLAYKEANDVLRFDVKPQPAPMRERMTFLFSDYNDNNARLDLEWDKLRVSLPIKAGTDEQVAKNIKNMTENAWRPYANAARYLLDNKKEPDQAMDLVEKSLAIKEDWLNVWVKAALLAQKGRYKEAYPLAQKAQALGEKSEMFFLAADVKKALTEWKAKQ